MGTTGDEAEGPEGASPEVALEPDLPICDAHHHLFEHTTPPYLLDALRADTATGHHVVSSVYVEAGSHFRAEGPRELRPVGETEWVASLPRDDGLLAGIVGHADMRRGAAAAEVLAAHVEAGRGRFRGVRHVVAWDPAPELQAGLARHGDMLRMPEFGEGVAAVGRAGLSFETWCYMTQLPQLVALVRANPGVAILVDHLGGPLDAGPYAGQRGASVAALQTSFRELARFERVHLKLGGLGMGCFGSSWTARSGPVSRRRWPTSGAIWCAGASTASVRAAACSRATSPWTDRRCPTSCCGTRSSA